MIFSIRFQETRNRYYSSVILTKILAAQCSGQIRMALLVGQE